MAYLDRVDEVWTGQLHEAADAAGPLPADRMVGAFDALVNACRRDGYRGCAFINAAAEALPDTPVHSRTVQHKTRVREWFRELAAEAGARDPETLAQQLSLVLDGGLSAGPWTAIPERPRLPGPRLACSSTMPWQSSPLRATRVRADQPHGTTSSARRCPQA